MSSRDTLPDNWNKGVTDYPVEDPSGSEYPNGSDEVVMVDTTPVPPASGVRSLLSQGEAGKIASELNVSSRKALAIVNNDAADYSVSIGAWMEEDEFGYGLFENHDLPELRRIMREEGVESVDVELPSINYVVEVRELRTQYNQKGLNKVTVTDEIPQDHSLYPTALGKLGLEYLQQDLGN